MRSGNSFARAGGCLVGLTAVALAAGCAPALVHSEEFTPNRIKEIKFADTCQLQPYFDANPEKLFKRSEVSVGAEGANKTAGKITFEIKPGPQADTFFRLVDANYKRVPPVDRAVSAAATVAFLHRRGQIQMPIGAVVLVETGEQEFELPYTPCLGAFFFGRKYYDMRAKLLNPKARRSTPTTVTMNGGRDLQGTRETKNN